MTLFSTPEEHAANPPESWEVVKVWDRTWHLRPKGSECCFQSFSTRKAALAASEEGFYVNLWHKERRWYAGEDVPGWKTYAQCLAERKGAQ